MLRTFSFLVSTLLFAPALSAEHFWGSRTSQTVDIAPHKLKPGQFIWKGNTIPFGPVAAVVSIAEQEVYLYRNGILIGVSTISSGRGRRSTPTGVFTVLGKSRHHRSRKYNNAPMPYAHWLTATGIAMHAGRLPGYPASHGCIRLPTQFARFLFESSSIGMPVIVTKNKNAALESRYATALLSIDTKDGTPIKTAKLSPTEPFRWQPEVSNAGPISIVMSKTDQTVLVYRNGIEIGRAKLSETPPEKTVGTYAYIMQKDAGEVGINPFLNNSSPQRWIGVGVPGYTDKEGTILNSSVNMPLGFAKALNNILTPGTTLLITDAPMLEPQITDVAQNTNNKPKQTPSAKPQVAVVKIAESPSIVASVEIKSLDTEIAKTQTKVDNIKQELANIGKRGRN